MLFHLRRVLRYQVLYLLAHTIEAVCWNQVADTLVRPLKVIVRDVFPNLLLRLLEARQRHRRQAFLPHVPPERLYLAACLRVIRPAADMRYPQLRQHYRELALATPCVILPPIVRQHLFRQPVFLYGCAEHFLHILCRLGPEKVPANQESAVVVHKAD